MANPDPWVVTIHSGGGSMVEAADPLLAILVPSEQVATSVVEKFHQVIEHYPDDFVRREWWATCFPVQKLPNLTSGVVIPGTQSVGIDPLRELSKLTEYLQEDGVHRCRCCNLTADEVRPGKLGKYVDRHNEYWCSECHDNGVCGKNGNCYRALMFDPELAALIRKGLT